MEIRNKNGLTEKEFIASYDASKFERPSVTVDILIFTFDEKKKLKILLVKRGDHPCLGQWAIPGGFVEMNESLDEAAARELKEETGVEGIVIEQLYTWGEVDRDPRTRIITVSYLAMVDIDRVQVQAGDDADEARWFEVKCQVVDKSESGAEDSRVITRQYRLVLESQSIVISSLITEIIEVINGVRVVKREISDTDNLAFDHGKIILFALEKAGFEPDLVSG